MKQKILIIEDEKDVSRLLSQTLQNHNYETETAGNGMDGLRAFRAGTFDLVLLDLMLPYQSGDEVLKEIRQSSDVPVIIISAKDLPHTKIDLLTLGADDYITKPFDLGEVAARVLSSLRRCQKNQKKQYTHKELVFDPESGQAWICQTSVELTMRESSILKQLLAYPDKVFTKANLYEAVWGMQYLGDDNVVKTHISNLRTKLKKAGARQEYIETVWGFGYRLAK